MQYTRAVRTRRERRPGRLPPAGLPPTGCGEPDAATPVEHDSVSLIIRRARALGRPVDRRDIVRSGGWPRSPDAESIDEPDRAARHGPAARRRRPCHGVTGGAKQRSLNGLARCGSSRLPACVAGFTLMSTRSPGVRCVVEMDVGPQAIAIRTKNAVPNARLITGAVSRTDACRARLTIAPILVVPGPAPRSMKTLNGGHPRKRARPAVGGQPARRVGRSKLTPRSRSET